MKPSSSSEYDEQDQEIIQLLQELGSLKATYPAELLNSRRAGYLAEVERLSPMDTGEELPARDQEIVKLLGILKSAHVEYPADLLTARRSAFLRQMEKAGRTSLLDKLRVSIQRVFESKPKSSEVPSAGSLRLSLAIASLLAAVFLGSLFLSRAGQFLQLSPFPAAAQPTNTFLTSANEVALTICKAEDQTPPCLAGDFRPSQDLADHGSGPAQPAVSKDVRSGGNTASRAAYVNDGRSGASWISNSPDSWIKIDLGQVRLINTVSLQKGSVGASEDNNPGQFVIAVALSDVYADGDSSNDYVEYAQVFRSEQTDFSGTVSDTDTIQTQFPAVQARFVKITFEKAGAAIEEVGVFMVEPPALAEQPTLTPQADQPESTLIPISTNTELAMRTSTSLPTATRLPTDTAVSILTNTPLISNPSTPLPTNTMPPTDLPTLIPTLPSSSDTPIPLPTVAPPTIAPPTAIPPTAEPTTASTEPIIVTGSNQSLTFTCNGNHAEIRGHANTVTLLGSCSSITVKGNGNRVYWQYGSPVIIITGKDNIVSQL